jgi:cyclopropane fatty-acyl-phospholipid synthase-like methyltransferase
MQDTNRYSRRAAFYEIEYIEDNDFEFWRAFITRDGFRVMDVPCGIGVRPTYLARHGAIVTGVDREPAMVERFKERLAAMEADLPVRPVVGDMRTLKLDERFDLVFCAREAFQFMIDDADALTTLRNLAAHLADEGRLVIDLVDFPRCTRESPYYLRYYDPDIREDTWTTDWSRIAENGHVYTRWHRQRHVQPNLLDIEFEYGERFGNDKLQTWRDQMRFRRFEPNEFRRLVQDAGLRCDAVYGDYEGKPYADGDPRMIFALTV